MMENSPEAIADERVRMEHRVLTPAQEPANTNRPVQQRAIDPSKNLADYPLRIVPHLSVYLGAACNTVNAVIEDVEAFDVDGSDKPVNLLMPLSRKNNGVAIAAFDTLFRFMQNLSEQNVLLIAADENVAKDRIQAHVEDIDERLTHLFTGEVIEQMGRSFSIDRADLFKTSVVLDYARVEAVDAQTVNEVHINVHLYIHVAHLTTLDNVETFNKRYKALVRNAATATGVDTALYVAFDVSNFVVRPSTLALFNSLLIDETVNVLSVQAVNGVFKHLPGEANTLVGVALTK